MKMILIFQYTSLTKRFSLSWYVGLGWVGLFIVTFSSL